MDKIDKEILKKERKSRIKRILFFIILIAIIILDAKVYENGGGVKGVIRTFLGQSTEKLEKIETFHVLVMGISTDLEKPLTDTLILCSYNPKLKKASMLSIPRDTFVGENQDKAKGSDKINSLYSESPQKTVQAVSKITGLEINNYAVIDTQLLVEIVDVIGGVDFNVPIDMDYDDETQNLHIHLKKGMQRLDGEKAEQLLRYRHSNPNEEGSMKTYPSNYGSDDYGRMRTQREFVIETIKQTIQIRNIGTIKKVVKTIFENMETNLNLDMIKPYVPYIIDLNLGDIESLQLPGNSEKLNNLWFFIYDKNKTSELVEKIK